MIPSLRSAFNKNFSVEKYEAFLKDLGSVHPGAIEFRVAETPVFVPKDFTKKIIDACESIVDIIVDPKFKELTKNAIPKNLQVPGENEHSHFIAFDFGVCINADGEYEPQLIEMQGFPSLFAYEVLIDDIFRKHFSVPENFEAYLGGHTRETYIQALKDIIVKDEAPENVILLEIFPEKQKTRIDFHSTEDYLGIKIVCLTKLIKEGRKLYYMNEDKKPLVKRIYNRVIFDDLQQQPADVQEKGQLLFEELDVEWVPHPNWFYRISKYTMPFIRHPYVPPAFFLNEIKQMPADLENYVLKPLFLLCRPGRSNRCNTKRY
ncbi:MAG: hypothetical protein WDO16_13230 [Bacteroidota bacterium]